MDWVAFTRACLPYVAEAKRRAAASRPIMRRNQVEDPKYCAKGHEAEWFYVKSHSGYGKGLNRVCRQCRREYDRRWRAEKRANQGA